jgi:short-subunit dehydrogenase
MIDLNVGALTDLCRMRSRRDDRAQVGRDPQRRLDRRLPARPQGMAVYFATKAFVLSFSEALHEELKPHGVKVSACAPARPAPSSARSPASAATACSTASRWNRRGRRGGLDGLDKNRAVVVPGWINKVGAASTRFAPRSVVRKIAGAIKY